METNALGEVDSKSPASTTPAAKKTVTLDKKTLILGGAVAVVAVIVVVLGVAFVMSQGDNGGRGGPDEDPSIANDRRIREEQERQNDAQGTSELSQGNQGDPASYWKKNCTGNEKVSMTKLPMNPADFSHILPLGMVAGGHVTPIDHLYFSPTDFNSARDKYPVFAMADGYIVEIQTRRAVVGTGEQRPPEYRIIMQHSCQTISYFDLVTSIDQSILDKVPQLATTDYVSDIHVPIKAGQEIARIGGQTLDTAVYNLDMKLSGFISPKLYEQEFWKIHTDDFYSYFPSDLQQTMKSKSMRKKEPISGKIDWDQPGKLIGNWFKEGTNGYGGVEGLGGSGGYWSGHLHVGYDAVLADNIWVSIGDFGGTATHFYVKGNTPDPAQVTAASGLVKYELTQPANYRSLSDVTNYKRSEGAVKGVILLQVMDGEKLKVEILPNKTASQVTGFSASAAMYVR